MRDQVAAPKPDVALVAMESFCADDASQTIGRAIVYEANFSFDLADALSKTGCRVQVVEIVSDEETIAHGRQGDALAVFPRRGRAVAIPEVESMGTDLYVGASVMGQVIREFIANEDESRNYVSA
jgi:hypothetical protein